MIKIPLDFSSKQSVNEPRSLLNIKCGGKNEASDFQRNIKIKET